MTTSDRTYGDSTVKSINFLTTTTGTTSITGNIYADSVSMQSFLPASVFRTSISVTAPVLYNTSTGVISLDTGGSSTLVPSKTGSVVVTTKATLSDHVHGIATDLPADAAIGSTLAEGTATKFSRSDHGHKGVRSLSYTTPLSGNVSILSTTGQKITVSGQTITFADYAVENYVISEVFPVNLNPDMSAVSANIWSSRYMNTLVFAGGSSVTLTSPAGGFIVSPGTYIISGRAAASGSYAHAIRLYNITNSVVVTHGCNAYSGATKEASTESKFICYLTLTATTTFRVEHCMARTGGIWGYPVGASTERYACVVISRL